MMLISNLTRIMCLCSGLVALDCGEGTESPGSLEQPQSEQVDWCKAACSYTSRCTGSVRSSCVADCLSNNDDYFSHVNEEYLGKVAPCISNAACTDWDTMTKQCYQSTAPTVTPSAAVIEFCKAMSSKFFECFYADDDLAFCVGDFAAWNSSGLARGESCATAGCDALNDCLNNAFNGAKQ